MNKIDTLKRLEEIVNALGYENCLLVLSAKDKMQAVKIEFTTHPTQRLVFDAIINILLEATDRKDRKIISFDKNYQQPENN